MGINKYDFSNPYQVKRPCCGAIIYEREEDYPKDYEYKPNKVAKIGPLDGTIVDYPYWQGKNTHRKLWLFFIDSQKTIKPCLL